MDGWNVTGQAEYGYKYTHPVKDTINGEPVTSMCATYSGATVNQELCYIPKTVKYMLGTYRGAKFENVEVVEVPAEYICDTFYDASGNLNKIKVSENLKGIGKNTFDSMWRIKPSPEIEGIPENVINISDKWKDMVEGD